METGDRLKCKAVPVHIADNISIVVPGTSAPGDLQVLRTEHQNLFSADFLDRRALPHVAEILESRNFQLTRENPSVQQVFAPVDQGTSLLILCLCAENNVIAMFFRNINDLRVALMFRIIRIRSEQRKRILFRPSVIPEFREAGVRVTHPVLIAAVSCVIKIQRISDWHGRSGIGTLIVIFAVRHQADAKILPCNEVR